MLKRLRIRNFKRFREVDVELGDPVALVGPNNQGKSSALQALALWHRALQEISTRRGEGRLPRQRPGVVLGRRDMTAIPVPNVALLWPERRVNVGSGDGQSKVRIEIAVEGETDGRDWRQGVEVDYANPESVNVRPLRDEEEEFHVDAAAARQKLAFLMPMSGLVDREYLKELGQVEVEIGQGRTAEVLRNLLYRVHERSDDGWARVMEVMRRLFGVDIEAPELDARAELHVGYREQGSRTQLDLSCSGRGMQQTLLVLSWLHLNRGGALLLDEPDAHLEVLRQRETWMVLRDEARQAGSQIIAATHSEKLLEHIARTDVVVAFVGRPHRIDDRGSQLRKAPTEIGFEDYVLAEQRRWVLYLEAESDLAILRVLARRIEHPAALVLDRAFLRPIGNVIAKAREHFNGLKEAVGDLEGFALIDHTPSTTLQRGGALLEHMWRRREIENYLATRDTLLAWARSRDGVEPALFEPRADGREEVPAIRWERAMEQAIDEVEAAKRVLDEALWSEDEPASRALDQVMRALFRNVGRPYETRKRSWYELAEHVPKDDIDPEVVHVLDTIASVAARAGERAGGAGGAG
ncbi:MAG TPA: AAA family ATPase [Myxococcota bacterium]|nr:AAA family ATPase [Myxococcota bacterium]